MKSETVSLARKTDRCQHTPRSIVVAVSLSLFVFFPSFFVSFFFSYFLSAKRAEKKVAYIPRKLHLPWETVTR